MGNYFLGIGQTILKLKCVSASRLSKVENNLFSLWLEGQQWARICKRISYGNDNQNLAYVKSKKYFLLRAFPDVSSKKYCTKIPL